MFEGFENKIVKIGDVEINLKISEPINANNAQKPALLLLHGYPQTHVIWHKIAPQLAKTHIVVAPDLRGYGDSSKPKSDDAHLAYSKREMAKDQINLMQTLGFDSFSVVGHDRGARVAHRLVRDHPNSIKKIAVLDIAPTEVMYGETDKTFATAYYHWFFLIQPFPLPERMIGADAEFYISKKLKSWGKTNGAITQQAYDEYLRCFKDPQCIHASCEDYRAAATIDLVHDKENKDQKIDHPLLALWGKEGFVGNNYDVLESWRQYATNVSGHGVPGGHYLPEEAPKETLAALQQFLSDDV